MFYLATNENGERFAHYRKNDVLNWYAEHNGNKIFAHYSSGVTNNYTTIVDGVGYDIRNIREDDSLIKTEYSMRKAIDKYDKNNTKQFKMKLNKKTDADIIEFLENQSNIQGTLKELIRQQIKNIQKSVDK